MLQDVMAKQESASLLAKQTLKIQRELETAAQQAQEEAKRKEFEAFQAQVREKNEVWRQRAEVNAAARKGDTGKASKARKRQQELEEEAVAHHEAEVDAALFGEEGSSDAEYGGEEAAEDEAAAECAPPFVSALIAIVVAMSILVFHIVDCLSTRIMPATHGVSRDAARRQEGTGARRQRHGNGSRSARRSLSLILGRSWMRGCIGRGGVVMWSMAGKRLLRMRLLQSAFPACVCVQTIMYN
jgi:hypothetical protein